MIPCSILILSHFGNYRQYMESSCARFKKASHNVPVMIPTFAFFWFNIHEIVQIRSLNLMYIRTIMLYHPHSG